ncbi:MAG: hypothetical protein O3A90_14070 [Proteobacteria bacterium]|jgi:hypothetical protein|nr:hypothetical protein [Pseudomonadota bacterium]
MHINPRTLRALARQYREAVRWEIGEANFATVLDDYKNCEDGNIGHEHDFCDANMVVLEIWERHFGAVDELNQEILDQLSSIMVAAFPRNQAETDQ